jgi:hypothetical protein
MKHAEVCNHLGNTSTTGNLEEKSTEEERPRRHSLHLSTTDDLQVASDRDS